MKRRLSIVLLLGVSVAISHVLIAADKKKTKKKQFKATCPVLGEPAKKESFVQHKGKKVYFCCEGCPDEFLLDPAKFTAKVHRQFVQTGQVVQVACPLTGHELDPETAQVVGGVKVPFCCPGCVAKVKKAKGDRLIALVFGKLSKGFTSQIKCPISGKPIKPKHVVTYKKQKVYFCCPKCPKSFQKTPKKYLAKLPQFKTKKKKKK